MKKMLFLFLAAAIAALTASASAGSSAWAVTDFSVTNFQVSGGTNVQITPEPGNLASVWARTLLAADFQDGEDRILAFVQDEQMSTAEGWLALETSGIAGYAFSEVADGWSDYREALLQTYGVQLVTFNGTANTPVSISFDARLLRNAFAAQDGYAYNFNWFALDFYDNNGFMGRWAPTIGPGAAGFEGFWDDDDIAEFLDPWYTQTGKIANAWTSAPFSLNIFDELFGPDGPAENSQEGAFAVGFTPLVNNSFSVYLISESWAFASVPEPATMGILGLGALTLLRKRK